MNMLVKMDDLGVPWGTHIFAALHIRLIPLRRCGQHGAVNASSKFIPTKIIQMGQMGVQAKLENCDLE